MDDWLCVKRISKDSLEKFDLLVDGHLIYLGGLTNGTAPIARLVLKGGVHPRLK